MTPPAQAGPPGEPRGPLDPELARAKDTMRRAHRSLLRGLRPEDASAWSETIVRRLADELAGAGTVLAFLALAGEPELGGLFGVLWDRGARVAAPRTDWAAGTITPALLEPGSAVVATRHGLREPGPGAPPIDPAALDAVLVPGLAFDEGGGRLGRGAGFYDRFLGGLQAWGSRAERIGVAFEAQVVPRVPADDRDMKVARIVTEHRCIVCRS